MTTRARPHRRALSAPTKRGYLLASLLALGCGAGARELPPPPARPATPSPPEKPMSTNVPNRSTLPEPTTLRPFEAPVPTTTRLSNGMRVWHLEQGPTPLVALLLVFPNGGATDPIGKEGLTALMADMLDEGAGKLDALEINDRLRALAVDHSAEVDIDSTMLVMHTIAETFEPAVELLADFVRRPTLPAEEFARRKEQRVARALAAEAEPDEVRGLLLKRALFRDGYGGDLSRGTRASLGRITIADVKDQFRRVIQPEGAELVVVGGIGAERATKVLDQAFAAWRGAPTAKPRAVAKEAPPRTVHLAHFEGAAQSTLAVARRADGAASPDYFRALVFNRSFGGAFTSRVNMNLREDKGYTYGARSSFQRYKNAGYFGIFAAVKSEDTRASIDETFKELSGVCGARPITEKERAESVSGLLLGFPGRFQTVGGVASQVASLPVYAREPSWLAEWPGRIEAVSTDHAAEIGRRYCDPKDFVVVIAGDKKKVAPQLEGAGLQIIEYDTAGNLIENK